MYIYIHIPPRTGRHRRRCGRRARQHRVWLTTCKQHPSGQRKRASSGTVLTYINTSFFRCLECPPRPFAHSAQLFALGVCSQVRALSSRSVRFCFSTLLRQHSQTGIRVNKRIYIYKTKLANPTIPTGNPASTSCSFRRPVSCRPGSHGSGPSLVRFR